jgi:hypothetical protein
MIDRGCRPIISIIEMGAIEPAAIRVAGLAIGARAMELTRGMARELNQRRWGCRLGRLFGSLGVP